MKGINVSQMVETLVGDLPQGPEYFPKDQLTDKPVRFFVAEIIREKILAQFEKEIPYSCQVIVERYLENDEKSLVEIHAEIYVDRESQKSILIGKNGDAINKLGTAARLDIEKFIEKRVYLDLRVKYKDSWRDNDYLLKKFGY